ncbi:MAG TPA: hypothetical protein VGS22_09990 [Thermoanaerobaculia bacterium]|jgi:hypothetical protein|nr:hypothetical protein [Thermoanaerobaculia bacterium]
MAAADVYTDEVRNQIQRYATWLPTDNIKVGTVGQLHGNVFVPLSHLKNFGIPTQVTKDPNTNATYKFMSAGVKEVAIAASASGIPTSAGIGAAKLTIGFSKAHSVYLALYGCTGYAIENLVALGHKLLELVEKNEWQLDYVVVTRIIKAESATILQTEAKNTEINLEGDASGTPVVDLLKAGASVKVKSQGSVGLEIVAASKLTPLFSLAKVKYTWVGKVLGDKPKFVYSLSQKSVGLGPFRSQVEAAPNIAFAGASKTKNDLILSVRLPKSGNYVDIADILDLTPKTTEAEPKSTQVQVTSQGTFGFTSRVPRKRFLQVVKEHPNFYLVEDSTKGQFINLNVTLPKARGNVSVEPLFTFAEKMAEPNASAKMKAELSFGEIL